MPTFITTPARVTVPATSANLGPGFDSLGMALSLRDELVGEVIEHGLEIRVSGEGADEVPTDESHLVVRSMRRAFDLLGGQPTGLRLTCTNRIPHSRGLGSSSAAIVGGVALARAMVAGGELVMDDHMLFELVAGIEGHPDNVAPAFFGGFTICGQYGVGHLQAGEFYSLNSAVDPRIAAVAFIPDYTVATSLARELIPATVPHAEAATNSGRTALLVAALAGRPEFLLEATRDFLHQDYRRSVMIPSHDLVTRLRGHRIAAVISGAGPTVLALIDQSTQDQALALAPPGWRAVALSVDYQGVIAGLGE